jgi:hypothetical protein
MSVVCRVLDRSDDHGTDQRADSEADDVVVHGYPTDTVEVGLTSWRSPVAPPTILSNYARSIARRRLQLVLDGHFRSREIHEFE